MGDKFCQRKLPAGDVDKDTGTWTPNPTTGKFYNYGSTPDELSSNAISQVPADSFIRRHDTMPKDATRTTGPAPTNNATSGSKVPVYNTPEEARAAVTKGILKSGDTIQTPQGLMRVE
jgi:hypothetical protein